MQLNTTRAKITRQTAYGTVAQKTQGVNLLLFSISHLDSSSYSRHYNGRMIVGRYLFELLGFLPSGKKSGVPERIQPANRLIANRIPSGWLLAREVPNRIIERTKH